MSAFDTVLAALEQQGGRVLLRGDQTTAQCPAHEDVNPSLSLCYDGAKVLLHCHCGCATEDVVAALGLNKADLFDERTERADRPRIVATYDYTNEHGELLFQKLRYSPKGFRVRRPDGRGGWEWKIGAARRVLYRLPELRAAIDAGRPVMLVEGEKDADRVAAELRMVATTSYEGAGKDPRRPKWRPEYTEVLRGAQVLIVADNDEPGLAHARAVAKRLDGVAAAVRVVLPAVGTEHADISDHLAAGYGVEELRAVPDDDPADADTDEQVAAREWLDRNLPEGPDQEPQPAGSDGGRRQSAATRLVQLAENRYRLGVTPDGEVFAVPITGPLIVRQLRGGRHSLRAELAGEFYDETGTAPSQSALADAVTVIEGRAQRFNPTPLHLRVAENDGALVLDLGDVTGRAVIVTADGWTVVDRPPVLFRRTALTGALPTPQRGGDLAVLWPHLNVDERYQPLVAAVLVAALMPSMPHVMVLITGEAGTGKTTATARLASVIDPSPAQVRKAPRDVETWTIAAAGSWMVALDNLSAISDWLSDALCRASTGDGDVRRRLYSDGELAVIAFRRAVIVNGIDVGALRGDLADRAVHLLLGRIAPKVRRAEEEMTEAWIDDHPLVLGAVLDLAVRVLVELPAVQLDGAPRMADFARVLAAVDAVLGSDGLDVYTGLARELAEDATQSEPVVAAIVERIGTEITGTAADLLAAITPPTNYDPRTGDPIPFRPPRGWPRTAREMTGHLRRHAPILRELGWTVTELDRSSDRAKTLRWTLARPDGPREGGKPAAVAAVAADDLFPQLSGGAGRVASGAATPDSPQAVAAPITAHTTRCLTRANEDHAANAATAARNPPYLSSTCTECGARLLPTTPGRTVCERCRVRDAADDEEQGGR